MPALFDSEIPSAYQNLENFIDYYQRLKQLACTMFKWEGLPETINPRHLEECLFLYGYCVVFESSMGFLCMNAALNEVNVYNEPIGYTPNSPVGTFPSGRLRQYTGGEYDGVLVMNTFDRFPTQLTTLRYAKALWDIDCSRDVNIAAQKTPYIIQCTPKTENSLRNMFNKIKRNVSAIFTNKDELATDAVKVLKTDAPFVAGQLQDMKLSIYNEYLMMLGISKANEDKKERFITSEVEQSQKEGTAMANILLAPRQEAAKFLSEFTGNEVSVQLRTDEMEVDPNYSRSNTSVNYNFGGGVKRENDHG